uniref:Hyaluronan/mRNA-binding protein domain-containing protein n=1 Tax=Setaria italica TaxID=4555 RepID=K3YE33_SETIT
MSKKAAKREKRLQEHLISDYGFLFSGCGGTQHQQQTEEKLEENVVSANDTEQKEASADNADAVPASESGKLAGGAAQDGKDAPAGTKYPFPKDKLNGSEKRKKKNAKKNSGTESEKVKKQDSETLAEYERMREEKKKTLEASKTEERKVTAEEFKGLQMLEKKKLDDEEAVIKVEKAQPKVKEASKKDENHRFNGGFQGGSRDNSTEPQVNGWAAQNEAGGHNGNGAPRGAYNGRGDGAPRGDYSGHRDRGHGGYQGNGGYQQQQGGNVGRYQQERASNGGYYMQRRPGNDRYYQQRRNFAPGAAPVLDVKDMSKFPALPVLASVRSAAPASAPAPAPAQASAPAAAPAQA